MCKEHAAQTLTTYNAPTDQQAGKAMVIAAPFVVLLADVVIVLLVPFA
jgi:hypothetical protein